MYALIKTLSLRHLVIEQLPALGLSLFIAEMFYKFHSFLLECIAFLGTWFVLDLAIRSIMDFFAKRSRVAKRGR